MQRRTKAMATLWRSNVQLWMSDSSNWARARLISSCMKRSSSILASFFASAGLDRTRRRSSTDKRDFRVGPAADWHCTLLRTYKNKIDREKKTYNVCNVFYQNLFHYTYRIVRWIPIITKTIHQVFHYNVKLHVL